MQHQPDRHRGHRAELRAQHHRPDHGDRRVGDRADGGEQAGDGEEGQERPRQPRLLAGALDQLVPDDGVSAVPGRPPRRRRPGRTAPCRAFEGDAAVVVDAEIGQPAQQVVGALPGDVGLDQVTDRVHRHPGWTTRWATRVRRRGRCGRRRSVRVDRPPAGAAPTRPGRASRGAAAGLGRRAGHGTPGAAAAGFASTPASLRWAAVIGAGAWVSGSNPPPVFGKAMTSRIESTPASSAVIRSQPNAIPPCGGGP